MVAQRSASRAPQLLPPCGRALRRRGDAAGRTQSSAMCALAGHLPPAPKAPNPRRVVRERAVDWVLDGRTVGESADALGLPVSRGLLYILWKLDKPYIFKAHLAQLATANMFNILIELSQHFS